MTEETTPETPKQEPEQQVRDASALPPVKLAFIIDGEVVDVLHTDERLAAIFLSEPVIKDVSDKLPLADFGIAVGSTYNSETDAFTLPASEE
jgi:hypothetical protein